MKRDELDHVRADVQQAVLEAQRHDPTVALEILWRLFDAVGEAATEHCICGTPGLTYAGPLRDCPTHGEPSFWAADLLGDVQLRATSKVPYGEAPDVFEPEDHR